MEKHCEGTPIDQYQYQSISMDYIYGGEETKVTSGIQFIIKVFCRGTSIPGPCHCRRLAARDLIISVLEL